MNAAAIWTGAATASDLFLLIGAIVAGIAAVVALLHDPIVALLPAAVCLVALGLLAA